MGGWEGGVAAQARLVKSGDRQGTALLSQLAHWVPAIRIVTQSRGREVCFITATCGGEEGRFSPDTAWAMRHAGAIIPVRLPLDGRTRTGGAWTSKE